MLCLLLIFSWPSMLFDINLSYTYCNRIQTVGRWTSSAEGRSRKPSANQAWFGGATGASSCSKTTKRKSKEKRKPVLGGSHFLVRTVGSSFWGQVLRIAPVSLFSPHSENCPGLQNLKKIPVKWFSGSAVLTEFWTVGF